MVVVETIRLMDEDPYMLAEPLLVTMGDEEELVVINLNTKMVMHKMFMWLKEAMEANKMEATMELEMPLQWSQLANYITPREHMSLLNKVVNKLSMVMNWVLTNGNIREICSSWMKPMHGIKMNMADTTYPKENSTKTMESTRMNPFLL